MFYVEHSCVSLLLNYLDAHKVDEICKSTLLFSNLGWQKQRVVSKKLLSMQQIIASEQSYDHLPMIRGSSMQNLTLLLTADYINSYSASRDN